MNVQKVFHKLQRRTPARFFTRQSRTICLVLTGAPGVGKGTFGSRLSRDLGVETFAMGDYLRQLIASTNVTDPAILAIRQGKLVPDEILLEIFQRVVPKDKPVILDGFPRTIGQALWLDTYKPVDFAINFCLPDAILIEKLAGRRVAPQSGQTYNIYDFKSNGYDMDPLLPKIDPTRCDISGELLVQRDDDKPEVVRERLQIYHSQTSPVLKYWEARNKLVNFEPKRGVKDYDTIKNWALSFLESRTNGSVNEVPNESFQMAQSPQMEQSYELAYE